MAIGKEFWSQITVNSQRAKPRQLIALYIDQQVVSMASYAHLSSPRIWLRPRQAKKRLGLVGPARLQSAYKPATITQSLSLSHIAKKLGGLKSSTRVVIVFPHHFFTPLDITLPSALNPSELSTTIDWAIEQQGFAPAQDWAWDLVDTPVASTTQALLLITQAQIDLYCERLGLNRSKIAAVVPDTGFCKITPTKSPNFETHGPWLAATHLPALYNALETLPKLIKPNLAYNTAKRLSQHYRHGAFQVGSLLLCVLGCVYFLWPQEPSHITVPQVISLPNLAVSHPIAQHLQLWQQILLQANPALQLQSLEFRRGRWYLSASVSTQSHAQGDVTASAPAVGQQWITQLQDSLPAPWTVRLVSSQSEAAQTKLELEISQ